MKFVASEEIQIQWHKETGYLPVIADMENPALMAFWEENPNFHVAIEQIAQTRTRYPDGSINYAALGGRAADYPAIRTYVVDAYRRVLQYYHFVTHSA